MRTDSFYSLVKLEGTFEQTIDSRSCSYLWCMWSNQWIKEISRFFPSLVVDVYFFLFFFLFFGSGKAERISD